MTKILLEVLASILDTLEVLSEFDQAQRAFHKEGLLPLLEKGLTDGRFDHCCSQIRTIQWKLRVQD